MKIGIRNLSPDQVDTTAGGLSEGPPDDEKAVTGEHEANWRGDDDSREDDTILGAGGMAGGLSGDGVRTDEYDDAVMGLDD